MRLRLAVLGAALALVAPALATTPSVAGRAYFVQNAATGEVLLSRDGRERLPIASITKLMTVLVALDHARPGDVVTVGAYAPGVDGSTIHLRRGERLTVHELIEAALIQSANDAAVALAAHVGRGSQRAFVALMNEKARRLGLTDTRFANASGLDAPGHHSSARDVTQLARIAMRHPLIRRVVRKTESTISGPRRLRTWNDLLYSFPNLLGVKTGHTSGAGWSEVAAAAGRGVTIYATLLGEATRRQRNDDLATLLRWGLSRYRVVPLVMTGRVYAHARAPYGRDALALVAPRRVVRVVRIDRPLVERIVAPTAVSLPVAKGQRLGEVRVSSRGRLLARVPLVASRSVERPRLGGRLRWYATRTADHVWGWLT